jgi:hypothetical protein
MKTERFEAFLAKLYVDDKREHAFSPIRAPRQTGPV